MNDEHFDKELSKLYQQRKAQFDAPEVNLSKRPVGKNYSFTKLVSIFTLGGVASFSILAIVTHFAKRPENSNQVVGEIHQIELAENKTEKKDEKLTINTTTLPPKPASPASLPELNIIIPEKNKTHTSDIEKITLKTKQVVRIPSLKDPEFIVKPIYKVMPKFPNKSLKDRESGAIKLGYEIDTTGKVHNIKIIESDVNRELQRSAINALAKWRYESVISQHREHEIIFEFNSEK